MPFSPGIFATLEPLQDGLINFSLVFSPSEMLFQLSWWSSPSLLCPRPSKLLLAVPQQNLHPQPASSAFCVVHNLRAFILVASAGFCRSPAPPPCSHWLLALRNAQARQTFSVEQKGNFSCCYGKDLKKNCRNVLQELGTNCVESQGHNVKPWRFREISSNGDPIKMLKPRNF